MSKPESVKTEPWADFRRQDYTFITDDFAHEKLAVLKVNTKSATGGVNIKETAAQDKSGVAVSDELKFWFGLPNGRSFYSKIKSNDYIKLHFDNGNTTFLNRQWNLYGTLNLTKSLSRLSWRVGAAQVTESLDVDHRIRINNEDGLNLVYYNRTVAKYNNLTLGLVTAYDITRNIIQKNNLLLGYRVDNRTSVFLRAENDKFRSASVGYSDVRNFFDSFKVDVISKYDDRTKVGIEAIFQTAAGKGVFRDAQFVVQRAFPEQDLTTKLRVSSKLDVSLLAKLPLFFAKNIGTLSVGLHSGGFSEKRQSFKYGAQAEFNI